jgi:hypothetical protein
MSSAIWASFLQPLRRPYGEAAAVPLQAGLEADIPFKKIGTISEDHGGERIAAV